MNRSARLLAFPLFSLVFSSCTHQQQQGAAIGTLGGAAIGAVAGDDSRDVLRGAALGAALGTGVAALSEDAQRRREAEMNYYGSPGQGGNPPGGQASQPPYQAPISPPAQPGRDPYPMAQRTNIPNQVISPYPPYNVMDVTDVRSGQLARDPKTGEIFRVP